MVGRIFKTKLYRVTYDSTGGSDVFSGQYILDNDWLLKMVRDKKASLERIK